MFLGTFYNKRKICKKLLSQNRLIFCKMCKFATKYVSLKKRYFVDKHFYSSLKIRKFALLMIVLSKEARDF